MVEHYALAMTVMVFILCVGQLGQVASVDSESQPMMIKLDAEASHILVTGDDEQAEQQCWEFKKIIEHSDDIAYTFAGLAREHSACLSGKEADGRLGRFTRGQIVKELDELVFSSKGRVGVVSDPVKSEFGWHLLLITRRGHETMRELLDDRSTDSKFNGLQAGRHEAEL
eukprot:gnl/TRDRNA2_/TRDRNA2_194512_c0_seq1.p1 gnl/TRDRNA2_/TRDRNA2_194512_c0~~gnl/TRDRNA2_/TRDRNA2_194512_c0_seq1.p1  ORF type:complete len:170 (-),score=32.81 gnl/TRDRNA2_/TRDRNA2_194512_c0_seq1:265-774(-)